MTKKEFYKELYALLQNALNRGTNHVSNIAINKVTNTYIAMGVTSPVAILKDMATIKPAKSVSGLLDNIVNGRRKGTRTDGQPLDFTGLSFE